MYDLRLDEMNFYWNERVEIRIEEKKAGYQKYIHYDHVMV